MNILQFLFGKRKKKETMNLDFNCYPTPIRTPKRVYSTQSGAFYNPGETVADDLPSSLFHASLNNDFGHVDTPSSDSSDFGGYAGGSFGGGGASDSWNSDSSSDSGSYDSGSSDSSSCDSSSSCD